MSLLQVIDRLTRSPARLLGLKAGTLEVGAPADLVIFNPDRIGKVDPAKFRSKSKNTPFDGRPVQGRILRTVVDGRSVFIAPESA
jgi:dihydroorotase